MNNECIAKTIIGRHVSCRSFFAQGGIQIAAFSARGAVYRLDKLCRSFELLSSRLWSFEPRASALGVFSAFLRHSFSDNQAPIYFQPFFGGVQG